MQLFLLFLDIFDFAERYFLPPSVSTVFTLIRLSRVLRLVRLSRVLPAPSWLVAFVASLPALFNICCLLLVLIFTYSVFGMLSFVFVKKEAAIDNWFNFETFSSSVMCLIAMTTGTGWGGLLLPMMATPPDCDPNKEHPGFPISGDCGRPILAMVFFISYMVLAALLLLQMYTAVVVEVFIMKDAESRSDDVLRRKRKEAAATVIQRAFRRRRAERAGDASGEEGPSPQD